MQKKQRDEEVCGAKTGRDEQRKEGCGGKWGKRGGGRCRRTQGGANGENTKEERCEKDRWRRRCRNNRRLNQRSKQEEEGLNQNETKFKCGGGGEGGETNRC